MATNTWNNSAATGLASNGGNWSLGHAPQSSDTLTFDGTSTASCTIDLALTVTGITISNAYTGTITGNTNLSHTINGDVSWTTSVASTLVMGSGSTWTVSGNWDVNILQTHNGVNYAGSTLTLTGSTKHVGIISNEGASRGTVNVNAGASYDQNNGDFAGIDLHNFGTITSSSELNFNRISTVTATRCYNHSTGTFTGVGTIIFTSPAQWIQQDGTVTISLGIIQFTSGSGSSLVPATYGGPSFIIYRQGGGTQSFKFSPGVYTFGDGSGGSSFVASDDGGAGTYNIDMSAGGITLNINVKSFNLATAGGGLTSWTTGAGNKIQFQGVPVTVNCNGLTIDDVYDSASGNITLGAALLCTSLNINNATFDQAAAHYNITTTNDFNVQNPGQWTAAHVGGSTITVGGSVLIKGVGGTLAAFNGASGWTLALTNCPGVYTANATFANFKNCTVTGPTLQADNSTDGGSNTGFNFSPAANRPVKATVARSAAISALGSKTAVLEDRMTGSSHVVYVNDTAEFTASSTINQTTTTHGPYAYYDATYQQLLLDELNMPGGPPLAPLSLSVTNAGVATWLATASATSYTLQRSAHGANVWTTVGSPTLPTFTDTVPGGGAYDYQVSATNAAGTSPYSTIATVTFPSLSLVGASAAANDSGSSLVTSLATTYAAATTTGNLLTCCVHEYSTPTLSNLTVTDNKGNTWTRATGISDGNLMCSAIFYTANATGGSNHIVTFHTSSGGIYMQMSIQEWANALSTAAPRGSGATATGTGTAVAAGSQSATAGDVVVGQMGGNFTAITITDAVGWTNLAHRDPVGLGVESDAEYIAAAANGNQNATWTLGSSHAWLACAQVFKPQT